MHNCMCVQNLFEINVMVWGYLNCQILKCICKTLYPNNSGNTCKINSVLLGSGWLYTHLWALWMPLDLIDACFWFHFNPIIIRINCFKVLNNRIFCKYRQAFTKRNNMASSGLGKMLYLPISILTTDGTSGCATSDWVPNPSLRLKSPSLLRDQTLLLCHFTLLKESTSHHWIKLALNYPQGARMVDVFKNVHVIK